MPSANSPRCSLTKRYDVTTRTASEDSKAGLAAMLGRTDLDPEWKAQQIANFETAIKEDEEQSYMAAFNSANHYAAVDEVAKVRTLIEIAAKAPSIADKVAVIREWLKNKIE